MPLPDPMSPPGEPDEASAVRAAFLVALLEDRERGRSFDLERYQQRYPGFEAVIAAEHEAFLASLATNDGEPHVARPRYREDGELGRGGMGVVKRVFDPSLHRYLALKQARAGAGEAENARFLEEARVTAQLDHPGVVAVHEVGSDETGAPYFTMPMVRGRTFAALIDELHRKDTEGANDSSGSAGIQHAGGHARIVEVLTRVCDTVAFAHSRGVVHRDLKPQNVMVGRFGEVFVVDWGLARALGRPIADAGPVASDGSDAQPTADAEVPARNHETTTPVWTLAGDVLGTPAYMAPEQLVGDGEVTCKLDIYALGAMLYHALAGHAPYDEPRDATDGRSVIERAANGPPTGIATRAAGAPPELLAICARAMARDPGQRYADAEALRADLRAFADGRVVGAYEHGKWAELRKLIRRNRAATGAAVLAVLALVIGLVASLVHADRAELSFHDSVEAVDRMLTRVANTKLRNVPETTAIRRDLLADATEFFERFVAQRPGDLQMVKQAAISYNRVAALHEQLGDRTAARKANDRSRELLATSRKNYPDDPELLFQSAKAFLQLGSNLDEGPDALETALAFADRALAARRDAEALVVAHLTHDALALTAYRERRLDDAEEHARASIGLCAELTTRFPDNRNVQAGNPHSLLAGILSERGDLQGSAKQLELAIAERRRDLAAVPEDELPRSRLAEVLSNRAILLHRLRDEEPAEANIAEAVTLRRQICERNPRVPLHHVRHASALVLQARIRYENGGTDDTLKLTNEAKAALERALARSPDDRRAAAVRFDLLRTRHRAWMRLARHLDAAANARALAEHATPPAPPPWRFEAVLELGDAVRLVDKAEMADDERLRLRLEYSTEAIRWLRELVDDDRVSGKQLAQPRLDPLRFHPEFPELR